MESQQTSSKALEIAHTMVEALEEKKGEDILLLDLVDVCPFTDYFVICTGLSDRTIRSLADGVREKVKAVHAIGARTLEGDADSGWVLLDYGDVVLHLFSPKLRRYYQLEDLWQAGQVLLRLQ